MGEVKRDKIFTSHFSPFTSHLFRMKVFHKTEIRLKNQSNLYFLLLPVGRPADYF